MYVCSLVKVVRVVHWLQYNVCVSFSVGLNVVYVHIQSMYVFSVMHVLRTKCIRHDTNSAYTITRTEEYDIVS